MKRIILATLFVACSAHADPLVLLQVTIPSLLQQTFREDKFAEFPPTTVEATGKGNTCDQALENAKRLAVDKAVGAWMYGERVVDQDKYREKMVEYSGGLIKSYSIVSNDCTTVTIKAEVVPRSNKINTNSAEVPQEVRDRLRDKIKNENSRRLAIAEVNDRTKAFGFAVNDVELDNDKLVITGTMHYQDKWKNDYRDLRNQAGSFTLDSFYAPVYVDVKGYNLGKEIFSQRFQLNYDVKLFATKNNGEVVIYPDRVDKIRLTFPVDSGRIMNVDKFVVRVI